jgi:hypothetical protein
LQPRVHHRPVRQPPGGIVTYAAGRLHEEVAYLAYHLHWPLDTLLDLEHADRLTYLDQVARINTRTQQRR